MHWTRSREWIGGQGCPEQASHRGEGGLAAYSCNRGQRCHKYDEGSTRLISPHFAFHFQLDTRSDRAAATTSGFSIVASLCLRCGRRLDAVQWIHGAQFRRQASQTLRNSHASESRNNLLLLIACLVSLVVYGWVPPRAMCTTNLLLATYRTHLRPHYGTRWALLAPAAPMPATALRY